MLKSIYKRLTGPGMNKIQLIINKCSQMMSNCPPEETFLHPSRIELSRAALKNNLRFLRALAQKGVRISSVIKGNAYGHGIAEFLPLAENAGIDHRSEERRVGKECRSRGW